MTKFASVLFAAAALAMVSACNNPGGYKKTPSGIMYRIVSKGSGPMVKKGEILKFHHTQMLNDSTLSSSFSSLPVYAKADSVGPIYSPVEVFPYLHKGDSVVVVMLADTILKKVPPGQASFIKKGDKINFSLKVLDILKTDELAQADQLKEFTAESEREKVAIRNYLTSKNINAQQTPKGVFVNIVTPGTGPAVDSGKYVSVIYTGKLFPQNKTANEKVFETNKDKAPIQFTINSGQVIPGWDEGLKLLKKGGKATLYIPATLAYGQQQGPGGQAFENLIFDVEVVDVANAAPPQVSPQMPMPAQPQADAHGHQGHADGSR